jgi:WD40 repeat protein
MVSVLRPPALPLAEARTPPSGRSSVNGPMSVALDGPNPSPHFVSLENIARLYIELKNDRDYLVQESARIFSDRINVVHQLREIEAQLNELIQQKARLEDSLDKLGLRDEDNRMQMAIIDDKVANISSESQRFEATVRELKGQNGPGISTSISPSETMRTASISHPKQVLGARPKPSPSCKRSMYGHTGSVLALDICFEKNVLISGSSDRSLRTWDTTTGRRLDTLYGHEGWVHAVAFASNSGPAAQRAVSGSGDKTVKVWDLADARGRGSCKTTIKGHEAGVTCVQLDDDNILVSGSLDKTLRRYDLNESGTGNCTVIHGHEQGVYCLQFVRHGLASGGGDSLIRMHDMRTGLCHRTLAGHMAGAVRALQFDDVQLVSGGADCMLRFWDLRTGGCTGAVDTGTRINAIHVDEKRVIVACSDHMLKVYAVESKELVAEHAGHLGPALSLTGADGLFYTGSTDQTAKLWSLVEPKLTPEP